MSKQKDNVSFSFRPLRKYRRPVSEVQRIETLFNRYSDENGVMTVSHLLRFLVEVQGEENTTEEAQAIIDVHKHRRCFKSERGLKLHSFLNYLFSDTNLPLSPFLENIADEDDIIQIEELQYESLIVIHDGKPKGGLKNCLKVDHNKVKCLSLSELELAMAVATLGKEIVRFTLQNLLRVYPKGSLINSSNYNPLIGWIHGAQMVAFNMQGYGKYLWLMHGMFKANGGCGYVKKPDFLLRVGPDNKIFDPKAILPVKTTLKVTIYMGEGWFHDFGHMHFDHSLPSFLTKVAIAGVPNDIATKRTKVVDKNWSPSWNEVFEFPLAVPELALLYVRVREHAMYEMDEFCGQTCLPVWELRSGIRAVPLYSRIGDRYYHVKLLMRFEFI